LRAGDDAADDDGVTVVLELVEGLRKLTADDDASAWSFDE